MKLRQLFRFRLRTLLVVFTITSIWLALHVTSTHRQQDAVKAIREYGGWVRYDFQYPSGQFSSNDFDSKAKSWVPQWALNRLGVDFFHGVTFVSLNYSGDSGTRAENGNLTDDALKHLPKLPKIRVLLLSDTQATDSSMPHLAALSKLEYLYMWDAIRVSDIGTANLQPLKKLKYIHLSSSQITDKTLQVLGELPRLEGLSLQFNDFSDEGLQHLDKLPDLKSLWVCGPEQSANGITDKGLDILAERHNLTRLGVQNTKVTDLGLASFEEKFPKCQIAH